jgi:membrane-bound lytic murein transglycosylase B
MTSSPRWCALVLVVAATACSAGGDDTGTTPTSPPPTAPVTTAPVAEVTATSTTAELEAAGETAEVVAAQIIQAERSLRDASASPAQLDQAGRLQQLAYRRLSSHAEAWDPVVAAAMPADVAPAFAANVAARNAFRSMASSSPTPPSTTLPAWRIRAPLPPDVLRGFYAEGEALTGVPWTYLAAIHLVETRMGRIDGFSTAGAQGPMQFLPSTWADCCEGDIDDDHDAIVGAARYLTSSGAPGDMARALFRYNRSTSYVGAVTAYAENMAADERAYLGYHAWQVFYASSAGDVRLPVGYERLEPVDAAAYVATHPEDLER